MIDLGILALLQLTLLPGLLITRWMKISGLGRNLFFAFFLSPIVSYLWVLLATSLGIYNRMTAGLLVGIELGLLSPLLARKLGEIAQSAKSRLSVSASSDPRRITIRTLAYVVVLAAASYRVALILFQFADHLNTVFTVWDAVVSWDRWALDWYNSMLPTATAHYPQLIPANWSLTYQIVGDPRMKFFAKDFMYLFEISALLIPVYLGVTKREAGYCAGAVLTSWLLWRLGSNGDGNVDTAVAAFGLASFVALLMSCELQGWARARYVFLGAVLAAGAALTKQAGLWIVAVYPLVYVGFVERRIEKRVLGNLFLIGIVFATLVGSWYGYKEWQIRRGRDYSEISYVTSEIHAGRGPLARLENGSTLLDSALRIDGSLPLVPGRIAVPGMLIVLVLTLFMLLGLRQGFFRWIFATTMLPYCFVWGLYFDYDARNLALVLPLVGLVAGMGFQEIMGWVPDVSVAIIRPFWQPAPLRSFVTKGLTWLERLPVAIVIIVWVPLLYVLPIEYPDSRLVTQATNEQKRVGDPILDASLYQYHRDHELAGKILSDYQPLAALPGLGGYYAGALSRYPQFIQRLSDPDVAYAMVTDSRMAEEVRNYVNQRLDRGDFQLIFESQGWRFMTTCRGPCSAK